MIIQLILLILVIVLLGVFMRNRNAMRQRAGKKILFILFAAMSVFAIIDPNSLTKVAHLLGVGRGADLLLYVLVLAFAFVTLSIYLKFKDYDQRLTKLARSIALSDSNTSHK